MAADPLVVLVEAVEEPGRPAAVPLEQRHPQARESLEDAARGQADRDGHHAERLVEGVPHHELVEDLEREVGLQVGLSTTVKRDGDVEPLALCPERVVVGVMPGSPVDAAGREEDRLEAELRDRPARFGDRRCDVVRRHHRGAEETVGIRGAEVP